MRCPPDDDEALREALAGVAPLPAPKRRPAARPKPPPLARQTRRDEAAALQESLGPFSIDDAMEAGDELVYVKAGLSRQVLRRLRRGHWIIEDSLDLHGCNRQEAAQAVALYLRRCLARGRRCVRIVHGKGLGSRNREPVLKRLVGKWLGTREEVLAYCQAPAAHGGAGAVLVLLKAA